MSLEKRRSLHSRYKPQAEADRYIDSLSLNENLRYLVLVEPGLGYMIAPLRKKLPAAKIISLHLEEAAAGPAADAGAPCQPPDSQWHPGTGISVQDFLETEIPDSQAGEILLLQWRPGMNVYGQSYVKLMEEAVTFIKRAEAGARTVKAFGRRWFKNFFNNLALIRRALCPVQLSLPVLVCGSGPGLEEAIPLIKERRDGLFILAASSSLLALEANGLGADMLISTDGGGWARFHLYAAFRGSAVCPIAAAATALLPSQCESLPLLMISDGSLWQALILQEMKIPFISLPQRGTVSATAVDLAFALTSSQVFIAGIDLENKGIRSHARPYSFDRLLEEKENRLNPFYSQTYLRSSVLKAGGSYGIYASWFEKQITSYPRPLYPLGKNNPLFGTGALPEWKKSIRPELKSIEIKYPAVPSANPFPKAYSVLEQALKDPAHSPTLTAELSPLLSAKAASGDELLHIIRSFNLGGSVG